MINEQSIVEARNKVTNVHERKIKNDSDNWEPCPRCGTHRVRKSWASRVTIWIIPVTFLVCYDLSESLYFLGTEVYSPLNWQDYLVIMLALTFIDFVWKKIHGVSLKCKDCNYVWVNKKSASKRPHKGVTPQPYRKENIMNQNVALSENNPLSSSYAGKIKGKYADYSQVPWFRKRWFNVISWLLFCPVSVILMWTGEIYYIKKDELKTYGIVYKIILTILPIAWTISFIMH